MNRLAVAIVALAISPAWAADRPASPVEVDAAHRDAPDLFQTARAAGMPVMVWRLGEDARPVLRLDSQALCGSMVGCPGLDYPDGLDQPPTRRMLREDGEDALP